MSKTEETDSSASQRPYRRADLNDFRICSALVDLLIEKRQAGWPQMWANKLENVMFQVKKIGF